MTLFAKWLTGGFLASVAALLVSGTAPASAADPGTVPVMKIKIFNDDPDQNYIFPVLTTGKGDQDIWLQAIFKVPKAREKIDTYNRTKNYRIYMNDLVGVAPGKSITLTIPLYSQLVTKVDPKAPDQYIDWWNGGTIQLYSSPTVNPPRALVEAYKNRPDQKPVSAIAGAALPTCDGCKERVSFFSDTSDLPKSDPAQLLEFTLGARVELKVVNPNTDPQNTLDLRNVDFDVSYVNLAYLPATMGPVDNDQVGYVGTPKSIKVFQDTITKFRTDFPGWPRFVKTYANGQKQTINKLPSPLELFGRVSGGGLAPPDLEAPPKWPTVLWKPIEKMRADWITWAGKTNKNADNLAGSCTASATKDTFCDGLIDAKKILLANYKNYRAVFATQCTGQPVDLTDDLLVAHLYGWSPFNEAKQGTGKGCPANVNLLQKTPPYGNNNYREYARVKLLFDKLNYGLLKNTKYTFNPWVTFIHGKNYLNTPNVYAYSVDDAVGNVQADGLGFIVDVGSTKHLENQLPADPPIAISYAIANGSIKMTKYRICKDDARHERVVNPAFSSFVINANNPSTCPIYFFDNKSTPQKYTFKVTQKPPFKIFQNPADAEWMPETSKPINCKGNLAGPPYQKSSATWCCDKSSSNGIFAFSTPDPASAHRAMEHKVILHSPESSITNPYLACNIQ